VAEKRGSSTVWWGNLRETVHSEDLIIAGRITLKLILKIGCQCVDWISVIHDGEIPTCCEHGNEISDP
jgi:hypothetical protein